MKIIKLVILVDIFMTTPINSNLVLKILNIKPKKKNNNNNNNPYNLTCMYACITDKNPFIERSNRVII